MERLTLIGLYNYDNDLFFDNISLPTGIDKDLTIDAILHRGGEFEVIYPDLDFIKPSIVKWFERHYRTFDKWITALNIEYDPLNNYDRYEESADNRAVSGNESGSVKDKSSSATNGATTGSQNNTVTNNVSAFDSATYQAKDQQITSGTDGSTTAGVTNSNNTSEDKRSHNTIDQNKHTAHLYGNIGVTTSQQMLQSELDIARFNIYDQIAELFIDDFCILVY